MKFSLIFFLTTIISLSDLKSEGFCTTSNLNKLCGVSVIEYDIDTAKINPSNKCKKVFFWIPPFSKAGEEKCYICGELSTLSKLSALVISKNKKCGNLILAATL